MKGLLLEEEAAEDAWSAAVPLLEAVEEDQLRPEEEHLKVKVAAELPFYFLMSCVRPQK